MIFYIKQFNQSLKYLINNLIQKYFLFQKKNKKVIKNYIEEKPRTQATGNQNFC